MPILDDRLKEKPLKPRKGAHSSHFRVCLCVCVYTSTELPGTSACPVLVGGRTSSSSCSGLAFLLIYFANSYFLIGYSNSFYSMGCGVIQRWGLNSESGKLCLSVVPNWVPSGHCSPVLCFCVWLWHFCLSFHAYFWFPSAFHHPIPSPCLNAVLSWSAVPRLSPPHTHLHISALSRTYGTVSHWLSVNDYLLPSVCLRIPLSRCAESEILHVGVVCSCCSFTLYWIWKVCSSCLVQFFIICSYTYSIH